MTERRQSVRHPTAGVYYMTNASEKVGPFRVADASEDGLFLETTDRPGLGSILIIEVAVDDRTFRIIGNVVRHIAARSGAQSLGGVGLKITVKPKDWAEIVFRSVTPPPV